MHILNLQATYACTIIATNTATLIIDISQYVNLNTSLHEFQIPSNFVGKTVAQIHTNKTQNDIILAIINNYLRIQDG